jgi:hypothetical protein
MVMELLSLKRESLLWIWSYFDETTTISEERKSSTSATSRHVLYWTTSMKLVLLLLAALKRRKGKGENLIRDSTFLGWRVYSRSCARTFRGSGRWRMGNRAPADALVKLSVLD